MTTCNGAGSRGDHCCWINGQVCEFLDYQNGGDYPVRCSIWDEMPSPEWEAAPVGQLFARKYPGYTCIDWPQNIPEVMERPHSGKALCCWSDA